MNRETAMNKIKKCLALSKSSNENESRAALLMARKLMAEYKIGSIDFEDEKQMPEERITTVTYTAQRDWWVSNLMNVIGPRYCCENFFQTVYGKRTKIACFLGFPRDLDICVPAFELAVLTIKTNCRRMKLGRNDSYSYAFGFIKGLEEEYKRQDAEMAASECTVKALTVLKIPEEVKEYSDKNFVPSNYKVKQYTENKSMFDTGFADGRSHLSVKVEKGNKKLLE